MMRGDDFKETGDAEFAKAHDVVRSAAMVLSDQINGHPVSCLVMLVDAAAAMLGGYDRAALADFLTIRAAQVNDYSAGRRDRDLASDGVRLDDAVNRLCAANDAGAARAAGGLQ